MQINGLHCRLVTAQHSLSAHHSRLQQHDDRGCRPVLYCTVLYCSILTWSRRSQEWESATKLLLLSSRHTLVNLDIIDIHEDISDM